MRRSHTPWPEDSLHISLLASVREETRLRRLVPGAAWLRYPSLVAARAALDRGDADLLVVDCEHPARERAGCLHGRRLLGGHAIARHLLASGQPVVLLGWRPRRRTQAANAVWVAKPVKAHAIRRALAALEEPVAARRLRRLFGAIARCYQP